MQELIDLLSSRFAAGEASLDATVQFAVGEETVSFVIHQGQLSVSSQAPDFTLYFADQHTLSAVLGDMQQALIAFREQRFRSSGYILWTFQVLGMFSPQGTG
ncbi:MAG: hypothetical protein RJQ07_04875 [Pseudomonadales bacterium]